MGRKRYEHYAKVYVIAEDYVTKEKTVCYQGNSCEEARATIKSMRQEDSERKVTPYRYYIEAMTKDMTVDTIYR